MHLGEEASANYPPPLSAILQSNPVFFAWQWATAVRSIHFPWEAVSEIP
jgi:hypothetical protein